MLGKGLRLYKKEKLRSVTAIERLFAARLSKGQTVMDSMGQINVALSYPIRMVYGTNPTRSGAPVQFLVSVPKKRLKHAVDRVKMRRRIREAYRLLRGDIEKIADDTVATDIAFIYVANQLVEFDKIKRAMSQLLECIGGLPALNEPIDEEQK